VERGSLAAAFFCFGAFLLLGISRRSNIPDRAAWQTALIPWFHALGQELIF